MRCAPFDELRPKLEKQYENAVFSAEECWDEARLRREWEAHRRENPEEERILARAFLTALILPYKGKGLVFTALVSCAVVFVLELLLPVG